MTDSEIDLTVDRRPTWWTRLTSARVAALPVMLAIAIVTLGCAYAISLATGASGSACRTQREFRSFMTDYLAAQVGPAIQEVEGFDELSPELQSIAIQLAPIIDAERENDAEALSTYIATFPIPACD